MVHAGDVVVELDDNDVRIRTVAELVSQAQMLTKQLLGGKPDGSVEAFLAERRQEVVRE